jgi:RNA polymerase sigma factor for flagellar operon FliA
MARPAPSALTDSHLWNEWKKNGSQEAKKTLIERYLPLVDYVVGRLAVGMPRTVSRDDLCSHGVIGLIDAVDKFDPDRGLQFETYATWRIRGAVIDGLRQGDWVPRSLRDKAKKIEDAYQKLEQHYLRSVTDAEIAEYLQVSEGEFRRMLQEIAVTTVCSLEDPIKEEDPETRMSLLVDENVKNPESTVHEQFLKEALAAAIDKLTEKERTVVSLFYYEDLSLSEIAEVMSLTPSRISQLHSKAILRLKGALARYRSLLMLDS